MNSDPSNVNVQIRDSASVVDPPSPSWGAIIAGAVAGLATHFLLLMLFTAIGLGAAEPATDDNPVATFGIGTAIVWSISALISLFVAGWVAGRCAARVHSVSGVLHGFLVWCVATIAGLLLVASGAGALVGGAAKIVGQGMSAAGKPLAGIADLAKEAAQENASSITGMIDEVMEAPAVKNAAANASAVRREVGQALRHLFREGGNLRDPQARTELTQALTHAGISEDEANQMVERWTASMDRLRAEFNQAKNAAATKAREAADKAADAMARASLWSFIGFVIAIAASLGGRSGTRWEYRHAGIVSDVVRDRAEHRGTQTHLPGHA